MKIQDLDPENILQRLNERTMQNKISVWCLKKDNL